MSLFLGISKKYQKNKKEIMIYLWYNVKFDDNSDTIIIKIIVIYIDILYEYNVLSSIMHNNTVFN